MTLDRMEASEPIKSEPVRPEPIKVLYIAGTMRSGSTLLARLLGESDPAVDVGEVGLVLSPQAQESGHCGCRRPFGECEFWEAVFAEAFGGIGNLDLPTLQRIKQTYRMRTLPRLLFQTSSKPDAPLSEYLHVLDALYRAIRTVSGARVIVDASKDPLYAYLLNRVPSVDVRALHLIRDSRAVAYSQQRVKHDPPLFSNPGYLPAVSPRRTALDWNAVNTLLGVKPAGRRSLQMRYEDLAADPEPALRRLWDWIGEPVPSLEFLRQSPVRLGLSHTFAGNPDRFQSDVIIKPDLTWRRKMSARDRRLVTALTFPLLLRHGYLRPLPAAAAKALIQPSRVL